MGAICKNCLVELGEEMEVCPLCGTPVNENLPITGARVVHPAMQTLQPEERHVMQRILWQIAVTLLCSGIAATLIIDLTVNKRISWSLYPIVLCVIVLSYAALFAFWRHRMINKILAGWGLATSLLVIFHLIFDGTKWIAGLGIPLLFAVNIISVVMMGVFRSARHHGLNLLAYSFVAIGVLCLGIEGIISHYFTGALRLGWSIIVAACLLPVTAALVFMFYRTRNNPTIQKIFHT